MCALRFTTLPLLWLLWTLQIMGSWQGTANASFWYVLGFIVWDVLNTCTQKLLPSLDLGLHVWQWLSSSKAQWHLPLPRSSLSSAAFLTSWLFLADIHCRQRFHGPDTCPSVWNTCSTCMACYLSSLRSMFPKRGPLTVWSSTAFPTLYGLALRYISAQTLCLYQTCRLH